MKAQKAQWLAVFCVNHSPQYSIHYSQEEANRLIDTREDFGECYGVATYHIPSKILHMRDPLNASDPKKVVKSIEDWLSAFPMPK